MRAIRLFLDAPLAVGSETALPTAARRHATQVLRQQVGDEVFVFNGDGHQYAGRLAGADGRVTGVRIERRESPQRESPLRLTLVQALAKGEKMDWIIQKATELGVARIAPVATERTEVKLDATRAAARLAHWQSVVVAACEQCGRNRLPEVLAPAPLPAYLAHAPDAPPAARWMLHPGGNTRIRDLDGVHETAILAVGPEGGFGPLDLDALRAAGYRAVGLGPRILRTETAGIAVLAAWQALYGDL